MRKAGCRFRGERGEALKKKQGARGDGGAFLIGTMHKRRDQEMGK